MQNEKPSLLFALLLLGALALVHATACSSSPDHAPPSEAGPHGMAFASPDPDVPLGELRRVIDVEGRVVAPSAAPRVVSLVDARGARQSVVANERGGFAFAAVTPPYDLAVRPVGEHGVPLVYFGVHRPNIIIALDERSAPADVAAPQPVKLTVDACDAAGDEIRVLTRSAEGQGVASFLCDGARTSPVTIDMLHVWRSATVDSMETIEAHAIVLGAPVVAGGPSPQSLSYSSARGAVIDRVNDPGAWRVDLPKPHAALSMTVPVTARSDSLALGEWRWTIDLLLRPDDEQTTTLAHAGVAGSRDNRAAIAFGSFTGSSFDAALPVLPGWSVLATATARHPRSEPSGGFERTATGWSGLRSIESRAAAGSLIVDVPLGPDMDRPSAEGILSSHGRGFGWTPSSAAPSPLSTLVVTDSARGRTRFRAMTNGSEVSFAKLDALGLDRLERGEHELTLRTTAAIPIDDAISVDPEARARSWSTTRPGSSSTFHATFIVSR